MRLLPFILLFLITCKSTDKDSGVEQLNNIQTADASKEINKRVIMKPLQVKAMTSEIMLEDIVEVSIKDRNYVLFPNGKIVVNSTKTNLSDTFYLNTDLLIEEAHFLDYKDELIIYYTETDYESGASFIESIDRQTKNLKWKNDIYGFNLTNPIVVENMTYVASFGFIGKLNIDSGNYVWKHDNLYETTRFNAFGSIEFEGDKVHFIESRYVHDKNEPGRIIINDQTGKIVEIIKNAP